MFGLYRDPHSGRRAIAALVVVQVLIVAGVWGLSRVSGFDSMMLVLAGTSLVCGVALWHLTKP
jgi:hypothetical protein